MANNETECSLSEVCLSDSDSELLIPTPWSDESKNEKRAKRVMKDKVRQEHVCEKEVPLNNNIGKQNGDLVEMPSNFEVLVCKQVANHGGDELVDKGRPLKRKMVYVEYMDDAFTEDEHQCKEWVVYVLYSITNVLDLKLTLVVVKHRWKNYKVFGLDKTG
ncbi:hypothetical protein Tco_0174096 [Tanacetum coccineum]